MKIYLSIISLKYFIFFYILFLSSLLYNYQLSAKVIYVGIYDNPPKIYLQNHNPTGIFIDIIEFIAQKEKWNIKYFEGSWEECLQMLENEKIDIMPDVAYSEEREKKYDFNSISIISSWIQLFVEEKNQSNFNGLQNKKIAIIKASIQEEFFDKLSENSKLNLKLIKCSTYEESINTVLSGIADAAALSRFYAFTTKKGTLKPTPFIYAFTTLHFASKEGKNREILLTIDKHMSEALNNPNSFYYKTLEKHLQRAKPYFIPKYLIWTIFFLIAVTLTSLIMILILTRLLKLKTFEIEKSNKILKRNIKRLLENEEKLNLTIKDKERLYQELNHRVKNNMNIICALISLRSDRNNNIEVKEFAKDIENKIFSIALVHQLLYKSENLTEIDIKEYIELFIDKIKYFYFDVNKKIDFIIKVESIRIPIDIAIPLGIVINELLSNSFKHAFPENYNGIIKIEIYKIDKKKINIVVSDNGIGEEEDIKQKKLLGLRIVFEIIEKQLHGKINYKVKNGVTYFIEIPLNIYEKRL